ncbi:MAG TPA: VOC family protein [Candidatus Thermoplasmatota archaeon]|nr:VOC family protein [Candidatus Thermoplasmatota archaeon]
MSLKYVGIRVTDLERSVKFYTEVMGLRVLHQGDLRQYGGGRGLFVHLHDPATGGHLELNWYPPGSPYAGPYAPGEALDHIGFEVENVEAEYRRLVALGVPATEVTPESTMGFQACVKDPDGNWIELYKKQ